MRPPPLSFAYSQCVHGSQNTSSVSDEITDLLPAWMPVWLITSLVVLATLAVIVDKIKPLFDALSGPARLARMLLDTPEEKSRIRRKRRFARHLHAQIDRLNQKEAWSDERYAELEAEVEVEGRRRRRRFRLPMQARDELQREKSITEALEKSADRLILLLGDPGAGKSVSMRHLASEFAHRVVRSRRGAGVLPIYVSLKNFAPHGAPDADAVRDFITHTLKSVRDRDVDEYVDTNFDELLNSGELIFLLDSFDEIPAILSSVNSDLAIRAYSDAIYNFLNGVHSCRGIIASRSFRAPIEPGWGRFSIVGLRREVQERLVRLQDLEPATERLILSSLRITDDVGLAGLAQNPLFLSLLCDHVRRVGAFPENSHEVFESFLTSRLVRDENRIVARFGLTSTLVLNVAEKISFVMTATQSLGLVATEESIAAALANFDLTDDKLSTALHALEYSKLMRVEDASTERSGAAAYTFAHRRFQEYFATQFVLRETSLLSTGQLLSDGRWRETAVTLLQTQSEARIRPITDAAHGLLESMIAEHPEIVGGEHAWPTGALHLLGILDAGLARRLDFASASFRTRSDELIESGLAGRIWEQKAALDVVGAGSTDKIESTLQQAFLGKSAWLRGVAFQQASKLSATDVATRSFLRRTLVTLAADGTLRRDSKDIEVQISRLPNALELLRTRKLLLMMPFVDAVLVGVALGLAKWLGPGGVELADVAPLSFLGMLAFLAYFPLVSTSFFGWGAEKRGLFAFWPASGLVRESVWLSSITFYVGPRLIMVILLLIIPTDSSNDLQPGETTGDIGDPLRSIASDIDFGPNVAWGIGLLMLITWSLSALWAIRRGSVYPAVGWTLFPALFLADVFRLTSTWFRPTRRSLMLIFGSVSGFAALIALGALFVNLVPTWVGIIMGVIGVIGSLYGLLRELYRAMKDSLVLRHVSRQRPSSLVGQGFYDSVRLMRTAGGLSRLFMAARKYEPSLRDPVSMALVSNLAEFVQNPTDVPQDPDAVGAGVEIIAQWRGYPKSFMHALQREALDEMGRFVEDAIAQQRMAGSV